MDAAALLSTILILLVLSFQILVTAFLESLLGAGAGLVGSSILAASFFASKQCEGEQRWRQRS